MAQTMTRVAGGGTPQLALAVNNQLMRGLLKSAARKFPYMNGTLPGQLMRGQDTWTVKWERLGNIALSTTALAEKTEAAFQMNRTPVTPTLSNLTAVVAKYGQFINVSEDVDFTKVNANTARLVDVLGESAGASANALQRNLYDSETVYRRSGGVASTSLIVTAISDNDVKNVVQELRNQSAMKFYPMTTGSTNVGTLPILDSYYGVVDSRLVEQIRTLNGFIGVEQYAGQIQTLTGEIGIAHEVRWCYSEIAPVSSGSGVTSVNGMHGAGTSQNDVFSTFIWGREAAGTIGVDGMNWPEGIYTGHEDDPPAPIELIMQPVGSGGSSDPFRELGTVAYKLRWTGKVLNSNWLKKITSLAPKFT